MFTLWRLRSPINILLLTLKRINCLERFAVWECVEDTLSLGRFGRGGGREMKPAGWNIGRGLESGNGVENFTLSSPP